MSILNKSSGRLIISMSKLDKQEWKMIEEVGEKGLKIIIHLANKDRAKLSDFKIELNMGSAAVYKAIHTLSKYGIIDETTSGPARYFTLTEKGKRVAELILKIEELLENP